VKRDKQLTDSTDFLDPRSFIGKRIHPGTSHPCLYLKGDDVGVVRRAIYARDGGRCTLKLQCSGAKVLPFDGSVFERWHLEHETGGLGLQRCWCPENLRGACWACHKIKDNRDPRWTVRAPATKEPRE
jgi:5-methylcytosine-specific restriction endonuclease McrA